MTVKPTTPAAESNTEDAVTAGHRVLALERDALDALADSLDERFDAAVARLVACTGRVIVSGMGKSGHIGSKIAATLASTGTPAGSSEQPEVDTRVTPAGRVSVTTTFCASEGPGLSTVTV